MVSAAIHPRTGQPIRERIGLYGPPKVGKTHQFLNIAKWHQDLGSDAQFYALSTDTSFEVLTMGDQFVELDNIHWTDVVYFQDYVDAARKYNQIIRPHDWLCVDLQSDAWAAVQDEYARASSGNLEDMGDLWATHGASNDYPIGGWEWGMPNARYRVFANNLLLRTPGHLMTIYAQKELSPDSASGKSGESAKVKEMFGHIGLKPAGQKDDPFRWHSILHIDSNGEHQQKMSTAGERFPYRRAMGKRMSRGNSVMDEPIEDFFMDYLVKIGRWEI